ncbi:hypothetical protein [Tenacibaculum sp. M341]|uniref:hypothetical protein n=1 Tax=Tenacibaculum sp. M341 TaxID=2530339 RepID=UPI001048B2EF|nr:hypothetical protein [Tenacibaculum sp. M341]
MKHYLFLIVVICFCFATNAQNYKGVIGKHEIFMSLEIDAENGDILYAYYFYNSQLKNIFLEGTNESSNLTLYETYSDVEDEKELFKLKMKDDVITGSWTNNGEILPVLLTKTTTDLNSYRLSKTTFIRDSISTHHNKELVWFTEKYSKTHLFRLGNGFSKAEREFLNPVLDSIHTKYAGFEFECNSLSLSIEVALISKKYISFTEYSSIDCGGAHPTHRTIGYNFDLKNKRVLDRLTDVYPGIDHYKLLKNKYSNDADLEVECEYFTDNSDYWKYYTWVFTNNGVDITPSYPHAMTPCETAFPITYKEIQLR